MREEVQGELLGRRERDAVVEVLRATFRVSSRWLVKAERERERTHAEEEEVAGLEQPSLPALAVLEHEPPADLPPVGVPRLALALVRRQVRRDERPLALALVLAERDPDPDRALVAHEPDHAAPDRRDGDVRDALRDAASARVDEECDAADGFARDEAVPFRGGRRGGEARLDGGEEGVVVEVEGRLGEAGEREVLC